MTDWDVYRLRSLKGGLEFTEDILRAIFKEFKEIEIRKIEPANQNEGIAIDGLLTALFKVSIRKYTFKRFLYREPYIW